MNATHAHVWTYSSDCDGKYEYHRTIDLPELAAWQVAANEMAPEEQYGDRDRLAAIVSDELTSTIACGLDLPKLTYERDGGIGLSTKHDEGSTYECFIVCTDQWCDDEARKPTQRDFTAEAAGY